MELKREPVGGEWWGYETGGARWPIRREWAQELEKAWRLGIEEAVQHPGDHGLASIASLRPLFDNQNEFEGVSDDNQRKAD